MIVKNAAKCRTCGTVLESKTRHDWVSCPCGNFVDGGTAYLRRGFMTPDALEELSITTEDEGE